MSTSYEPITRTNDNNSSKDNIDYSKKYRSINDFRNNVEKAIIYDESRQSMINLYQGTKDEEWFLEELIKNFDQLVSYDSGIRFISEINYHINDECLAWILLRSIIRVKKNSNQAILLIEDAFDNFEKLKKNENYYSFFIEILKIYKGDEAVKEILNSFDWKTDKTTVDYLSCFCHFFPVIEIQFFGPYINDPLKFIDNENDTNILDLILSNSDEKLAEELIFKLIPNLPSFFNYDFLNKLIITMIDHASTEQLFSIYTAFDIALRKKSAKFAPNFNLAVSKAIESMDWKKRFEFFSAHFNYFKNTESELINHMLKTMELNEKNYKK